MSIRLALLLCLAAALPAHAEDAGLAARLDAFARPYDEAGHLSGVLLVARGDEILVERAWGLANHEWQVRNAADTRFVVASINKPITLILVGRMVDRRLLDVTAPIADFLPDFPKGHDLRVIDLMTHQAGVPHRVTEPDEECVARSPADMVELVKAKGLMEDLIGTRSYSTAGYAVLARILEIAGGAGYSELLRQLVLEPADARSTVHPENRRPIPHRAECYLLGPDGPIAAQPKDLSFLVGGGALISTASDLHRILRTLVTGGYGETAKDFTIRGRDAIDWNGTTSGYRANVTYRFADDLCVIFCSNVHTGAGYRLLAAIESLVDDVPIEDAGPPQLEVTTVDPALLDVLSGEYQMRPGTTLRVHTDGSILYSNEWPLLPLGDRRFFSLQDYGPIEFVPGADGSIERLDWFWTGAAPPMAMPRVSGDGGSR